MRVASEGIATEGRARQLEICAFSVEKWAQLTDGGRDGGAGSSPAGPTTPREAIVTRVCELANGAGTGANGGGLNISGHLRSPTAARYRRSAAGPREFDDLRQRVANAGKASDQQISTARQHINEQIADPLDFDDNIALARLDVSVESLQEERQRYEAVLAKLLAAAGADDTALTSQFLAELDELRDDFDRKIEADRSEMQRLAGAAVVGTRAYQRHVVQIGLALLAIAALLGITVAAAVTLGLVRPVRRLLAGTAAVEGGALDTVVPITSRDEIGRLTQSFNSMVGELRIKAQIRETFGKYVDPRIVAGLIDRPELTDAKGSRREMTILFCDMKGFTTFSEGMTPAALVTVLNRYMTVMSEPVRHHSGIIDKYIGDAIMAFWGPPFTGADEQARLSCLAALDQLAAFAAFRTELPDLIGLKRGFPEIDIRIGIATGDVVVGSIGSEQTRNYTVIGDTVNLASRIEGANKTYGTRVLISEATNHLAADMLETREIDSVVVVGKTEPQRIFELLGRKGEVASERLALRDAYVEALDAYRRKDWEKALAGFEDCLAIVPCEGAERAVPRTHRSVPRHRPICRVEWRLVAGGEVGTATLLRAVCRRNLNIPDLVRIVVAIDPAVSTGEDADETGIIVAGKDADGHGYVLADQSARYAPTEWARIAIALYRQHKADRIVAEVNNGGDMVESTIRMIDPNVSYSAVRASRGKVVRAEPVAALYEQRRIHHVGAFPTLEDQMCAFAPDFDRSSGRIFT